MGRERQEREGTGEREGWREGRIAEWCVGGEGKRRGRDREGKGREGPMRTSNRIWKY